MKKPDIYLKEYCQRLSDEQVKFLYQRLDQRLGGDMAEVFDYLSNVRAIDRWLSGANSCDELYDMVDQVNSVVQKEYERRNVPIGSK